MADYNTKIQQNEAEIVANKGKIAEREDWIRAIELKNPKTPDDRMDITRWTGDIQESKKENEVLEIKNDLQTTVRDSGVRETT